MCIEAPGVLVVKLKASEIGSTVAKKEALFVLASFTFMVASRGASQDKWAEAHGRSISSPVLVLRCGLSRLVSVY